MSQKIALGVSYRGTDFHGWQFQNTSIATVQMAVEKALSVVADHPVQVTCAGRTDAGVHATKQVVHFETQSTRSTKAWTQGVNAHLPDQISIDWSSEVPADFDARHSAVARRYYYLILNRRLRSGLHSEYYTREHRSLDVSRMHQSGQYLLGEHDFTSFRAAHCQANTPIRNIHHIAVERRGDLILVDIQANAFLHHMVRNIVGVLMDIGAGTKSEEWMLELLGLKDRNCGSATAQPHGLYLVDVVYPNHQQIPQGCALPHFFSLL